MGRGPGLLNVDLGCDPLQPLGLSASGLDDVTGSVDMAKVSALSLRGRAVWEARGWDKVIAVTASSCRTLRDLDVSFTKAGSEVTLKLIEIASARHSQGGDGKSMIHSINLAYCDVGITTVPAMARALESVSSRLRSLTLRYSPVTAMGLGLLLKWAINLAHIDCRFCGILTHTTGRETSLAFILEGLRENTTCTHLQLEGNGFQPIEQQRIFEEVAHNKRSAFAPGCITFANPKLEHVYRKCAALAEYLSNADAHNTNLAVASGLTPDGDFPAWQGADYVLEREREARVLADAVVMEECCKASDLPLDEGESSPRGAGGSPEALDVPLTKQLAAATPPQPDPPRRGAVDGISTTSSVEGRSQSGTQDAPVPLNHHSLPQPSTSFAAAAAAARPPSHAPASRRSSLSARRASYVSDTSDAARPRSGGPGDATQPVAASQGCDESLQGGTPAGYAPYPIPLVPAIPRRSTSSTADPTPRVEHPPRSRGAAAQETVGRTGVMSPPRSVASPAEGRRSVMHDAHSRSVEAAASRQRLALHAAGQQRLKDYAYADVPHSTAAAVLHGARSHATPVLPRGTNPYAHDAVAADPPPEAARGWGVARSSAATGSVSPRPRVESLRGTAAGTGAHPSPLSLPNTSLWRRVGEAPPASPGASSRGGAGGRRVSASATPASSPAATPRAARGARQDVKGTPVRSASAGGGSKAPRGPTRSASAKGRPVKTAGAKSPRRTAKAKASPPRAGRSRSTPSRQPRLAHGDGDDVQPSRAPTVSVDVDAAAGVGRRDRVTPALLNACMAGNNVCRQVLATDLFHALPAEAGKLQGVPQPLVACCGLPDVLNQLRLGSDERITGIAKLLYVLLSAPCSIEGDYEEEILDHAALLVARDADTIYESICRRSDYDAKRREENRKARALLKALRKTGRHMDPGPPPPELSADTLQYTPWGHDAIGRDTSAPPSPASRGGRGGRARSAPRGTSEPSTRSASRRGSATPRVGGDDRVASRLLPAGSGGSATPKVLFTPLRTRSQPRAGRQPHTERV